MVELLAEWGGLSAVEEVVCGCGFLLYKDSVVYSRCVRAENARR